MYISFVFFRSSIGNLPFFFAFFQSLIENFLFLSSNLRSETFFFVFFLSIFDRELLFLFFCLFSSKGEDGHSHPRSRFMVSWDFGSRLVERLDMKYVMALVWPAV